MVANEDLIWLTGNRRRRANHAKQHPQNLRAWREVGQPARQDGSPLDSGQQFPPRSQPSEEADVVEGHEDEDVHHHWYHHSFGGDYCAFW